MARGGKKEKKGREKQREVEFDSAETVNPLQDAETPTSARDSSPSFDSFEQEESPGKAGGKPVSLQIEVPAAGGSPRVGADGEVLSPVETPTPRQHSENAQNEILDFDQHGDRRQGRRRWRYLVFMSATLFLLPVYSLFFIFMAWVYYLVPNAIALVALIVSFFLPAVLYMGWSAAVVRI